MSAVPSGLRLHPGYLDRAQQQALLAALRRIFEAAPLFTPRMPRSGRPASRNPRWNGYRRTCAR